MQSVSSSSIIQLEQIPCPLCGSERWRIAARGADFFHGVPGQFQMVRCGDCRHLYLNPRPTPDTILNCYPADYGPHQVSPLDPDRSAVPLAHSSGPVPDGSQITNVTPPTPQQTRQPWYLSPTARRIPGLRALYYWLTTTHGDFIPTDVASGSRVLELGCATGNFLKQLQDRGCLVTGVEPVSGAAVEAQQRGFSVHIGTLESAELKDEQFDAAFAWMVIEHLIDPRATLLELKRVIRPDGSLVFSVPNAGCWERHLFGGSWWCYEWPRHLHLFTPASLRRLLSECGYDRVRVIHQHNLSNVVSSLGIVLLKWFPGSRWAARIRDWPNRPTLWKQLALAPLAKLMAWLHQGGRLTVVARRRTEA
jgi:2-polyprenyl-3-methyl-5-hydroxy-6-metoxy-1,4-benzoquinol methylase